MELWYHRGKFERGDLWLSCYKVIMLSLSKHFLDNSLLSWMQNLDKVFHSEPQFWEVWSERASFHCFQLFNSLNQRILNSNSIHSSYSNSLNLRIFSSYSMHSSYFIFKIFTPDYSLKWFGCCCWWFVCLFDCTFE